MRGLRSRFSIVGIFKRILLLRSKPPSSKISRFSKFDLPLPDLNCPRLESYDDPYPPLQGPRTLSVTVIDSKERGHPTSV